MWFIDRNNDWGYGIYQSSSYATHSYTDRNYYGAADPQGGGDRKWDVVMKWTGTQYLYESWHVEGVSFSSYKGAATSCTGSSANNMFVPKLWAYQGPPNVWRMKDFTVTQANSLSDL